MIDIKTDPVTIFMFWLTTWLFLTFFPLVNPSSREINLIFLFFLSLFYQFFKLTVWFWWRFGASSLIIRLCTLSLPFTLALTLEGLFSNILPVKSSDLKISIFAKSWKLLFRHVFKSGCCCCFWVEHAISLTKCVGGNGCNTVTLPESVSFRHLPWSKEIIIITRRSKNRSEKDISRYYLQ